MRHRSGRRRQEDIEHDDLEHDDTAVTGEAHLLAVTAARTASRAMFSGASRLQSPPRELAELGDKRGNLTGSVPHDPLRAVPDGRMGRNARHSPLMRCGKHATEVRPVFSYDDTAAVRHFIKIEATCRGCWLARHPGYCNVKNLRDDGPRCPRRHQRLGHRPLHRRDHLRHGPLACARRPSLDDGLGSPRRARRRRTLSRCRARTAGLALCFGGVGREPRRPPRFPCPTALRPAGVAGAASSRGSSTSRCSPGCDTGGRRPAGRRSGRRSRRYSTRRSCTPRPGSPGTRGPGSWRRRSCRR